MNHAGAHGGIRRRALRIDGHRHPDRGAVAALAAVPTTYFIELFAQVTNPPLDAIRVRSSPRWARTGPEQNLLNPTAASCRQIHVPWPILDNDELNKIVHINDDDDHPGLRTAVLGASTTSSAVGPVCPRR